MGATALDNVAKANANLGKTLNSISDLIVSHAEEQNKLKNEAWIADTDTHFRLGLQNKLLSDAPETVKVDGQDVTRPSGILNRKLNQANGSLQEFDSYYTETRNSYLTQTKNPELQQKLAKQLDDQYINSRNMVISNESKQGRAALVTSQMSNAKQQVHDAAAINDPDQLLKAIDNISSTSKQISDINGDDPITADKTRLEFNGNVVSNSVISTLNATGDLEKAQGLLDASKEYINPDRYEKISSMLTTGSERIQKQNLRVQTAKEIGNQAEWLTNLADGKLSWMSVDDVGGAVNSGQISERFGAALTDVIKAQGKYEPRADENENYPAFIESVYKAKDQTELHSSLLNILQDHKNMSQEKLSVLINGAMNRGKNLPLSVKQGDDPQISSEQIQQDSGAQAIVNYGKSSGLSNNQVADVYQNYNQSIAAGKPVKEAYDTAINAQIVKNYPVVATMEGTPHAVINPDSKVKYLNFSPNVITYPSRIVDNKGIAKVNTNKSKNSGGDKK